MKLLTRIIRSLLTIIPAERGYKMAEAREIYDASAFDLFGDIPIP